MKAVTRASSQDSGFGLIEIIISMFLLAVLAIAFLPLLMTSMKATVQSSSVATASQLLSEQLDAVRALPKNCQSVSTFDDSSVANTLPSITDSRGVEYQPTRSVGSCPNPAATPADYPRVVTVRASVTIDGDASNVVEAETLVYLESAAPVSP